MSTPEAKEMGHVDPGANCLSGGHGEGLVMDPSRRAVVEKSMKRKVSAVTPCLMLPASGSRG